ncbi:fatty-acid amide hydrolase 2-A-like [Macrosteles quadrilineatus]|uniref:fatty-acid amide hydrolase 2-A-like n=1 Tax=Macrosteles quadrilineatus TaxID=74068 RepID=UPI0023E244DC|nr:fatty-acid amide hydrolase 2-A-like [Macrosteles quadrilineatus]
MEVILRLLAVVQNLLCFVLEPLYWLWAMMKITIPLQTIRNPILTMSATELATKIRTGELTCEEVVEVYSFRSRRVNMKLNAIVDERYEEALKEAERVDELITSRSKTVEQLEEETPLLGVPVSISGCFRVKGMNHAVGCVRRVGQMAEADGAAVAELRRAGAIVLVTTNTPEQCVSAETHNLVTGVTKNPYNYHRTVGSSAGGEASLIGGAGSVVGIGSEWLGSIRGPAMYAGVFAHRPPAGIVPVEGHFPEVSDSEAVVGPMTRYAEDLPLMLRILGGGNAKRLRLNEPVSISDVDVYYMTQAKYSIGLPIVDKSIKQAVTKAVDYLKANYGCKAEKVSLDEMSNSIEISRAVLFGRTLPDVFEENEALNHKEFNVTKEIVKVFTILTTYSLGALGYSLMKYTGGLLSRKSVSEYIRDKEVLRKKLIEKLGKTGVLVMPTHPSSAHYHHQWMLRPMQSVYCDIITALGLPATNVPMGLNSSGLPIGIQVVGAPDQDRLCLAVAQRLEKGFSGWAKPPCMKPPSET